VPAWLVAVLSTPILRDDPDLADEGLLSPSKQQDRRGSRPINLRGCCSRVSGLFFWYRLDRRPARCTVWWYVVYSQQSEIELTVTGVQQLGTPELVPKRCPSVCTGADSILRSVLGITAVGGCCKGRDDWRFRTPSSSVVKLLTSSPCRLAFSRRLACPSFCSGICTRRVRRVAAFGAFLLRCNLSRLPGRHQGSCVR